jgi:signal transduction histidine kinase
MALLDGLLAFSRAGEASQEQVASSVRERIDECIEECRPLAERVDAKIDVQVMGNPRVRISTSLLHVALANLLNNALKFLEGCSQRQVRISATGDAEQQRCLIVVEDTGPGISGESLPKLFDPFYRAPGTSVPGTGIGLATVQRIVLAHGGQVSVSSVPTKGARFVLSLPLADEERSSAAI